MCGGGGGRIKARSVQGCVSKKCMMLIFFFNPCTRSPVGVGSTRLEHTFLACTTAARFKYARPVLSYVLLIGTVLVRDTLPCGISTETQ